MRGGLLLRGALRRGSRSLGEALNEELRARTHHGPRQPLGRPPPLKLRRRPRVLILVGREGGLLPSCGEGFFLLRGALRRGARSLGETLCLDGPRSGFVKPLCNRKNHNIIYPPDAKFCLCGPFPTPKDFIGPLKHLLRYLFTPLLGSQSRRRRALAESGFVKPLALRAGTASWPTRSQAARSTLCVARG